MQKTQHSNTPPLHHSGSPITIVSGGQTGADRAALDWALDRNVECGDDARIAGAEDGPIDPKCPLKETPSASYLQRTKWNLRDSDATVLFSIRKRRVEENTGVRTRAQQPLAASLGNKRAWRLDFLETPA
jgi:Circularly permutated YpsA SLOG family